MLYPYRRHPLLAAFVVLVWLLLSGFTFGGLLVGVILALLITPIATLFWTERLELRRPRVLLRLIPRWLWDIVTANAAVAWCVVARRPQTLQPAFLHIPLELENHYGCVFLASIITLTPGTVSVQFNNARDTLYVHALDCPDPDAAIATIRRRYEQPLRELLQ